MTCAGGAIAFESLIMYGLWCAYKCTPTDLKGGWYGAAWLEMIQWPIGTRDA
jgi:hypothetical protein